MDPIDVAEMALSLSEVDPDKPSPARIYDYWLGGSQNFAADREVGRRTAEAMPHLPLAARANRAFLARVVHHLVARCGISQLLDLGSGVPTAGNVHEVARRADPDARIVYVDIDPVAIAHARSLLADVPGTEAILADLRRPEAVLAHPLVHDTLDLDRPVAVLMFAVLHFIGESAQAAAIVRDFVAAAAPGSYLALSHGVPDADDPQTQSEAARAYQAKTGIPYVSRDPAEFTAWLRALEIQPPGVVPIDAWMPEAGEEPRRNPLVYGALARKP
jgi:SAM-dependent methyltransferase